MLQLILVRKQEVLQQECLHQVMDRDLITNDMIEGGEEESVKKNIFQCYAMGAPML